MQGFTVVVFNATVGNLSETDVQQRLIKVLKLNEAQVKKIMAQERTVIKKNLPEAHVAKYKAALEKCGIAFEIKPPEQAQVEQPAVKPLRVEKPDEASEPAPEAKAKDSSESLTLSLSPKNEPEQAAPAEEPQTHSDIYQPPEAENLEKVFCRFCGAAMAPTDRRCGSCGKEAMIGGRSKVVAGFLAFFMGGLGIHRFYLRQWWGIFYIPLAFVGIGAIVVLIEAIYFWCCSKEHWEEKYGHLPPTNALTLVLIGLVPLIAVIGILAAIALPAYNDYTHRAKVAQGIVQLERTSKQVGDFILKTDFVPSSNLDAGLQDLEVDNEALSKIEIIEGGKIVGTFNPLIENGEAHTIIYVPNITESSVTWRCNAGTMPDNYRPPKCRGGDGQQHTSKSSGLKKYITSNQSQARVKVPSGWREGVAEQDEATLNAGNVIREAYVIMLEDDFDLSANGYSLEEYAEEMAAQYDNILEDSQRLDRRVVTADGLEGYSYDYTAKSEGYDIHYVIAFYAIPGRVYQIWTWSLKSRFRSNEQNMRDIIESFELTAGE